tara:strand:+ start:377 stop:583 length:207 start_codon:yes stop_codon:yes gene_type:complete
MINPSELQDKITNIFDKVNMVDDYRFTHEEMSLVKEAAMLDFLTASQLRSLVLMLADEYVVRPAYTRD